MTSEPRTLPGTTAPTQLSHPIDDFVMRFSSTPRGARLARRLAALRLHEWGVPYDSEVHDALTLIVAELCANAVQHGHVAGRDFRLRLAADAATVRIEVTDTRTERLPAPGPAPAPADAETGCGLLLVARLATRWGWYVRIGAPGKTVWAECALPKEGETAPAFRSGSAMDWSVGRGGYPDGFGAWRS
ncbi:ATP-binding protein [Streptomyces sp. 21So2-11]|uniref:ATP-binding protein n=1 Tax=Streptomyces sp. 21So2-11 TaxID=3144408 RepID=UPI00321B99E4